MLGRVRHDDLPRSEFAFPGPLRDRLVAAILSGAKTSTTGLWLDYQIGGEELALPGELSVVIDSQGEPVAVIETTSAVKCRVGDIDLRHAIDEGEGYESVAQWREGHERFWHSAQMREALGDPGFTVDDDTIAVAERFRVVERLWRRDEVVAAFTAEATAMVAALRGTPEAAFANPTRCPPWTVAQELAHTVLACSRLEAMLAQPAPAGPEIAAAQYFRAGERFGAAATQQRIADAQRFAAETPIPALLSMLENQLTLIPVQERLVTTRWGDVMRLTDFLATRVFELAVHGVDLADGLGVPPWLTDAASDVVEGLLLPRGGQTLRDLTGWSRAAVLRKATGREPVSESEGQALHRSGLAEVTLA
jgi:uncharacterized protein (TIGR03083 family)